MDPEQLRALILKLSGQEPSAGAALQPGQMSVEEFIPQEPDAGLVAVMKQFLDKQAAEAAQQKLVAQRDAVAQKALVGRRDEAAHQQLLLQRDKSLEARQKYRTEDADLAANQLRSPPTRIDGKNDVEAKRHWSPSTEQRDRIHGVYGGNGPAPLVADTISSAAPRTQRDPTVALKARRLAQYHTLVAKQQSGEPISESEQLWLKQVAANAKGKQ